MIAIALAGHAGAIGWLERSHASTPGSHGDGSSITPGRIDIRLAAARRPGVVLPGPLQATASTATIRSPQTQPVRPPSAARSRLRPPLPLLAQSRPSPSRPSVDETSEAFPAARFDLRADANETPVTSAHFYTFDEVELPAAPASDWELDAATLDSARIGRLVFDLFVSDDGTVVGCTIVEPPTLDERLRASLEARLRSTVLLPAVRTGRAVDSVRRIELTVS